METECCNVHTPWEVNARVKGSGRERGSYGGRSVRMSSPLGGCKITYRRAYFQEMGGTIKWIGHCI